MKRMNEGYTRYWEFGKKVDKKKYQAALKDITKMLKAGEKFGIIGGWEGDGGSPDYEKDSVNFNGIGDGAHENCLIDSTGRSGRGFLDLCKTARKPYDEYVGAALKILDAHINDSSQFNHSSDGSNDDDGERLFRKYSSAKNEALKCLETLQTLIRGEDE